MELVAAQQHRAAAGGASPEQAGEPPLALRVEAVGRFVQDQRLRVAEQRLGHPESLPHAQRVGADATPGLRVRQADLGQHLPHPAPRQSQGERRHPQGLQAAASRVESLGAQQRPDGRGRVGQVGVAHAAHGGASLVRGHQPGQDAQAGGLAGPVRAEETDDLAGGDGEGHVVEGEDGSETFGHMSQFEHGTNSTGTTRDPASGNRPVIRFRPASGRAGPSAETPWPIGWRLPPAGRERLIA